MDAGQAINMTDTAELQGVHPHCFKEPKVAATLIADLEGTLGEKKTDCLARGEQLLFL